MGFFALRVIRLHHWTLFFPDSCIFSYHTAFAETFQSKFHGHSPFRCDSSVTPPSLSLQTADRHKFPGASWEKAACSQCRAHSPHACSSLKYQIFKTDTNCWWLWHKSFAQLENIKHERDKKYSVILLCIGIWLIYILKEVTQCCLHW